MHKEIKISNRDLLLPYFAPYFAYVGIASLFQNLSVELNYALRIIVVVPLIAWAWKWYVPITGPKNLEIHHMGHSFRDPRLCILVWPFAAFYQAFRRRRLAHDRYDVKNALSNIISPGI